MWFYNWLKDAALVAIGWGIGGWLFHGEVSRVQVVAAFFVTLGIGCVLNLLRRAK